MSNQLERNYSAERPVPEVGSGPANFLEYYLQRFAETAEHHLIRGPRYRIAYSVLGDGPPLYLVHGICNTSRMYAPLLVELARSFRVVTYHHPGILTDDECKLFAHGLADYPKDLFFLADHLGDRQFGVIGNSFGVSVTIRAMVEAPERITKAMLVGGFLRRPLLRRERFMLQLFRLWPGRMRHAPLMAMVSRFNHERELRYRDPELIDFYLQESGEIAIRTAVAQTLAVDENNVADLAEQVRQPVLVIHGEEDRLVSMQHASELAQRLCNVRIMLVPRCGHLPHLSHPELLAHAAEKFFLNGSVCPMHATCGEQGTCDLVACPGT